MRALRGHLPAAGGQPGRFRHDHGGTGGLFGAAGGFPAAGQVPPQHPPLYEQKIAREVAEQILEAGRFTETAKNTQGVRYVFLQNELAAFKALVWEGWRTWCEAKEAAGDPDGRRYMVYYRRYERDPADDRLFFNAPAALAVLTLR